MNGKDKDGLKAKLYELCPDILKLGLYLVVIGKGSRY
jgi:hypothetical protein